jgi:ParB/RepB/Spo0J family partition protein
MPEPTPDDFRAIPLDQIVEPWVVLRVVNRESIEYLELRDSLAAVGPLNSICVRPSPRRPGLYEVVDGLYRFTAACELRLPSMPCIVKHHLTDEDVLAFQIQANALRPETTVTEYARQIKRIMDAKPGITRVGLSNLLHKNADWIRDQLNLLGLRQDIQKAVDRGEIPLQSAYMLAKLPRVRQVQFIDLAKVTPVREFAAMVAAVVKQIKEDARQGKLDDLFGEFTPVPYLRALKEVFAEYQEHRVGGLLLVKAGCKTPIDAWHLALRWALNLDEESIRQRREKALARMRANILEREEGPCSDETSNDDDNE